MEFEGINKEIELILEKEETWPAFQPKKIGTFQVALMMFFAVASGPVGIEGIVRAGGLLGSLIALLLGAIFSAVPQAALSIELSSRFPHNGGPVLWFHSSFGSGLLSWLNAYINVISKCFDIAIWPVCFLSLSLFHFYRCS